MNKNTHFYHIETAMIELAPVHIAHIFLYYNNDPCTTHKYKSITYKILKNLHPYGIQILKKFFVKVFYWIL